MFTTRPEISGSFGAVASTHWIASAVGMAVLERGGNAADAAVAAGFTLQIAEPHLNGPLGDCPILVHDQKRGTQNVICGQGPAPAALSIALVRDRLGLDLVPGTGLLPAMVPGAFDAWATLLRDWGTWKLADVLDFAIGYASRGIPYVPRICATIETVRPLFEQHWPTSAALWLRDGGPQPGKLWSNPILAATYARVLREAEAAGSDRIAQIDAARQAWYGGFVAEAIGRFCASTAAFDTTGSANRGVLTADDMARWRAGIEAPVSARFRGVDVLKCGAWSQGPAMLMTLRMLDGFDLAAMEPMGAEFAHTMVECMKRAFADREAFLGDPDHAAVPLATLLSDAHIDARRASIGRNAALDFTSTGGILPDYEAAILRGRDAADAVGAGEPTVSRLGASGGDTCHVSVIDRHGNMVAATPSGGWLQSSPAIPELGCCLGTRGQMFWLDERHPNALAPGKRPRTTLSPSMALRDGRAWMAFGTPGGEQQDQWQPIFLTRMLAHGLNIQQAIDAPAFHSEHWVSSFWPRPARPGKLVLEGRYDATVADDLRARGHDVTIGGEWSEGRLSAVRQEPDGRILAGANPRGMQGYAVGR
jgi:gamma-glutamyltranspeptidase / glutathione hydrolase